MTTGREWRFVFAQLKYRLQTITETKASRCGLNTIKGVPQGAKNMLSGPSFARHPHRLQSPFYNLDNKHQSKECRLGLSSSRVNYGPILTAVCLKIRREMFSLENVRCFISNQNNFLRLVIEQRPLGGAARRRECSCLTHVLSQSF